MAPSHHLSSQLRQVIYSNIDNDLLENARFLAERLHAIDTRNLDSIHLLALCHYRLGQLKAAYDFCRLPALKREHLGCIYVFAQSCLGLGRYNDGVTALERLRVLWEKRDELYDPSKRFIPDAATFHCLLGKLHQGNGDVKRAVECYVAALKLNPLMWDAFERLCETGTKVKPSNIFKQTPQVLAFFSSINSATAISSDAAKSQPQPSATMPPLLSHPMMSPSHDPFASGRSATDNGLAVGEINLLSKTNTAPQFSASSSAYGAGAETPPAMTTNATTAASIANSGRGPQATYPQPPNAPVRKMRVQTGSMDVPSGADAARLRSVAGRPKTKEGSDPTDLSDSLRPPMFSTQFNKRTISGTNPHPMQQASTDPNAAPQRRSVRLFRKAPAIPMVAGSRDSEELKKAKATGTRGRSAATSTVGRIVSGNRKPVEGGETVSKVGRATQPRSDTSIANINGVSGPSGHEAEALAWFLDVLAKLGNGYYCLSQFDCRQALQYFSSVAQAQRETAWVLAQTGKAQYEQGEHHEAEKTFVRLRKLAPTRMKDMEIYSTLLWHLKNDTELAFLSHELVEADRQSPEAWCTIGNSFSLQRDHEQALKCFRRSTQLHPGFAYGYTLQGHEHMSNEDYDKALLAYRKAVTANRRHYNGWYGLGRVYEKLGKFDMAEKHYVAAANINPGNAILVCFIGTVLDKQGKNKAALAQYDRACELAPKSAVSRFRRAKAMLRLRLYEEALAEFMVLKDIAPDEANVHFMLGKTYKMLSDKGNAIKHFTTALNLDPKAANLIKEAMETLTEDDMSDDDEDDEAMD